jgi:hypothetical protein
MSEPAKLSLLEAFSLPVLSYACEAVCLEQKQIHELSVCVNNMYRRVFHMNKWESVKCIQYFCGRLDFVRMYHCRKLHFILKTGAMNNTVLDACCYFYKQSDEWQSLVVEYEVNLARPSQIKAAVFHKFAEVCNEYIV